MARIGQKDAGKVDPEVLRWVGSYFMPRVRRVEEGGMPKGLELDPMDEVQRYRAILLGLKRVPDVLQEHVEERWGFRRDRGHRRDGKPLPSGG